MTKAELVGMLAEWRYGLEKNEKAWEDQTTSIQDYWITNSMKYLYFLSRLGVLGEAVELQMPENPYEEGTEASIGFNKALFEFIGNQKAWKPIQ